MQRIYFNRILFFNLLSDLPHHSGPRHLRRAVRSTVQVSVSHNLFILKADNLQSHFTQNLVSSVIFFLSDASQSSQHEMILLYNPSKIRANGQDRTQPHTLSSLFPILT